MARTNGRNGHNNKKKRLWISFAINEGDKDRIERAASVDKRFPKARGVDLSGVTTWVRNVVLERVEQIEQSR